MALTDTTMFTDDMTAIIADLPSSLVFGSDTVSGTRSEWEKSDETELVGFRNEASCEWHAKLADFTTAPDLQAQVTVDGDPAYVYERDLAQEGIVIVLYLRKKF